METFNSLKKAKGKNKLKTYKQEMIDSFLSTKKDEGAKNNDNEDADKTTNSSNRRKCVGIMNSIYGPKR